MIDYENYLWITIAVVVLILAIIPLYRHFYRTRRSGGTDQRNWVNKTNYNIHSSEEQNRALDNATEEETEQIIDNITHDDAQPPSSETFHRVRDKRASDSKSG